MQSSAQADQLHISAVSSPTGALTGLQRTYLAPRRANANVPDPRKAHGRIHHRVGDTPKTTT